MLNSNKFVRENFLSLWRKLTQCAYASFCVLVGWQFYSFYLWATGTGEYVPRPPAVEAFLPISALMSLKRLVMTGRWDPIHPAGLAIFISVLVSAVLFRRGFCGWVCPVGLLSDAVEKAGRAARISLKPPLWVHYPLLSIKYLLLGFFVWIILVKMDTASIESFLKAPYNITVDARMLQFFISPSGITLGVMLGLLAVSFVFKHFWCTYCCPYGALLGIVALPSPLHVHRQEEQCMHCHRCQDVCPAGIAVWRKETVRVPECIGCMECVAACPEDGCLRLSAISNKISVPVWLVPVGVIFVLLCAWLFSLWTGHWHTVIPDQAFQAFYRRFLPH